jgi:hypothetical protein
MNEKVNDKTKEEIMPFTPAFQRQLVAMLLADKEAPKYIKLMKPKYFDNPVLRNLVILIISFFNRYSRPPTRIELLEEVDIFLEKDKGKERLPVEEYMNISQKVLDLAESDFDFEPTKDKAMEFIQHQAFERAIMKSGEELLKDSDYEGIMKEMNEAASIGSLEDGALRTLSSIEPKDVA